MKRPFLKTVKTESITIKVDRASATEMVDLGSILSQIKPKTIKLDIHSFYVGRLKWKKSNIKQPMCVVDKQEASLVDQKVLSLSLGRDNLYRWRYSYTDAI